MLADVRTVAADRHRDSYPLERLHQRDQEASAALVGDLPDLHHDVGVRLELDQRGRR